MKIAIVTPPYGQTGGPEVVADNLASALLALKLEVTLFAPGDWKTDVPLVPTLQQSIWNMPDFPEQDERVRMAYHIASQIKILNHQNDFDLIHLHAQSYAYAIAANISVPCLLTLHNPVKAAALEQLRKASVYTVAVSATQKGSLPIDSVVWNSVPTKHILPSYRPGSYLLIVGRITKRKGIHRAIEIARKANQKLIIIGRIGLTKDRQEYYKTQVQPFVDGDKVEIHESIPHEEIYEYMRNAKALLLPTVPEISKEPFGMVVAEALACGTPVLATKSDTFSETLGMPEGQAVSYLSDDIDELAKAAQNTDGFDRHACRAYAEKYFDTKTMAEKYLALYQNILHTA